MPNYSTDDCSQESTTRVNSADRRRGILDESSDYYNSGYLFSLVRRSGTKRRIRNYVSQQRDDQQVCD
jgi:hypothetical protein